MIHKGKNWVREGLIMPDSTKDYQQFTCWPSCLLLHLVAGLFQYTLLCSFARSFTPLLVHSFIKRTVAGKTDNDIPTTLRKSSALLGNRDLAMFGSRTLLRSGRICSCCRIEARHYAWELPPLVFHFNSTALGSSPASRQY